MESRNLLSDVELKVVDVAKAKESPSVIEDDDIFKTKPPPAEVAKPVKVIDEPVAEPVAEPTPPKQELKLEKKKKPLSEARRLHLAKARAVSLAKRKELAKQKKEDAEKAKKLLEEEKERQYYEKKAATASSGASLMMPTASAASLPQKPMDYQSIIDGVTAKMQEHNEIDDDAFLIMEEQIRKDERERVAKQARSHYNPKLDAYEKKIKIYEEKEKLLKQQEQQYSRSMALLGGHRRGGNPVFARQQNHGRNSQPTLGQAGVDRQTNPFDACFY